MGPSPIASPPGGACRTAALSTPRPPPLSPPLGPSTCPAPLPPRPGGPALLAVPESQRRPGTRPQPQVKLFLFAGSTGGTHSSPNDPRPNPRNRRRTSDAQLCHLLLLDSAAWGRSRVRAARVRGAQAVSQGPRTLAQLGGDSSAETPLPWTAAGGLPRALSGPGCGGGQRELGQEEPTVRA